ncbi:MAG: hypothetical protein JG775_226 [Defluviitaleaceae bacterium]|jgi:hypothetical protein|nr:hypothetical protein [Defluviitalea raffinosedens]MBZ4667074.1 hypothetical protein [Defluviitaleaceae bacterium]
MDHVLGTIIYLILVGSVIGYLLRVVVRILNKLSK